MKALRVQPLRRQTGFTLIELVMVMVIIAILAAVAIPKFIDLSTQANTAALNGVAGALTSASAVNYAARKASSSNGNAVANCTDVATSLQGGLPSGYVITSAAIAANASALCTVTQSSTTNTANFTATGIL
jgi:MSHA pilin protein MshA